ncbi:hypothetical protein BD408DRAFT_405585 [Parasitella parasitica]|nr:hypothetical protein BD408DRAFT_405585 [Parasitella parasitica]
MSNMESSILMKNLIVLPSKAPKSLMAAKTFTVPIKQSQDLRKWFTILAAELHRRIIQHYNEYGTWPKAIALKYATLIHSTYRSKGLGTFSRDDMKTHVEEHSDYHFAMDLMNEERQQLQQNRLSSSLSNTSALNASPTQWKTAVKKRKTNQEKSNQEDKKQKRSLFFQPKRNP